MCEFKIIRKNDGLQLAEEIVVLGYGENQELYLKDIIGMGEVLESALILSVNTLNQTTVVLEHPLAKDFLSLMMGLNNDSVTKKDIDNIQVKLEELKKTL